MRNLLGIALIVALVAYAAFVVKSNDQMVAIELPLLLSVAGLPLWQGLLGAFILGLGLAACACLAPLLRLRWRNRRLAREIARLEQEVHGLRTLPLEDVRPDIPARRG